MVENNFFKFPKLFFYILCIVPIAAQAMERATKKSVSVPVATRVQPLEPCRLFATPKDNIILSMAEDIQLAKADDYIGLESPFLSNNLIIHELTQAAQRGAQVKIFIDQKSLARLRPSLEGTKIVAIEINNLHAKRMVIRAGTQKIVWLGSMNMSEHSSQNHEIMMRCTDPEVFKESIGDQHRLGQPIYNRAAAAVDFSSRRVINSSRPEAQEAKKRVIDEFGTCSHPHDYLYFVSYTLDDPALFDAIMKAKKSTHRPITVLLDGESWKNVKMRHDALMPLVKEGVNVYIYNKNNDIKTTFGHNKIMHIKAILRKCNQQCLALVSTANFTPRGKEEINHDLWEPCSLEFSRRLKEIIDSIISESVLLTHRDFPAFQTPEQKTARLLELMNSNTIHQNKDEILRLIQEGADPNAQADDRTLLMAAINADQIDIVRALIQAGADVNTVTPGGFYTALIQASMQGRLEIVQLLIDAKAQLDWSDPSGSTALYLAVARSRDPRNVVKKLIEAGADVNLGGDFLKDREKEFGGVIPPIVMAAKRRDRDLIKILIAAGANPNARDRNGFTALEYACQYKDTDMIKELAQNHANLNLPNPWTGETVLIRAVSANDYNLAKALVHAGADVHAIDREGKTAMYYAVRKQSQRMIDLLNSVK